MEQQKTWQERASFLLCTFFGIGASYLALRYLLPILLPFLIGILLAILARRLAGRASRKIPCGVLAPIILTVALFFFGLLLRALIGRLLEEGRAFLAGLPAYEATLEEFWNKVLGAFKGRENSIRASLASWLPGLLGRLLEWITSVFAKILSDLPDIFFSTVVILIAAYGFSIEGFSKWKGLIDYFPTRARDAFQKKIPMIKERAKQLSFRYLRAYLLLFLITWGELLVGFLILKVNYALLISFLVAFVDFLPVLGTGSVLIPWGVIFFFNGNPFMGGGILILYVVILLVRQFLEPHLLGRSLGLHPILTLFAGYAGWCLFGIGGMLLGPIILILLRSLLSGILVKQKEKRQMP